LNRADFLFHIIFIAPQRNCSIDFQKIHFARQQGGDYTVVCLRPITPRNYFSESLYIISGGVTLRSPEGFRKIVQGDLIFFEEGPQGAHQLYNHGDTPCMYLDIRTTFGIDVCEYPDSGKINILPFQEIFENGSKVDYYREEEHVTRHWPQEVLKNFQPDNQENDESS
jgi:hypothetical protein